MPEQDKEFRIDSDKGAEWALTKIKEAKAEREKWEAFYNAKLEAVRAETQNTIDFMTYHLQQYFNTQEHRVTKTGIHKYSLPSGELVMKPAAVDYEKDETKMLAWCKVNLPNAVKVTEKAAWADIKAYIKETGEIPDGVTVVMTEPAFQIKEA